MRKRNVLLALGVAVLIVGLHQINCILIGVQIGLSGREERLLLLIQKDRETIQ
ncbi:MAG: hypothetical protein E6686_09670 [Lachnospiraceae bacterium]|nr:hypothetical protein [Lachnospiraceae bacterium]